MNRFFTISNIFSVSRIFLLIPIIYCLINDFPNHRLWTAGLIALAISTDFLDGFLARKLHQVTEFGKIVDPIADKICIGVYAITLTWIGDIPIWYMLIVLLRDFLIFLGGLYVLQKKKIVPQSNLPGKIAVNIIAFVFFLATIKVKALEGVFILSMWLSVVAMIWSLMIYSRRLFIGRNIEVAK